MFDKMSAHDKIMGTLVGEALARRMTMEGLSDLSYQGFCNARYSALLAIREDAASTEEANDILTDQIVAYGIYVAIRMNLEGELDAGELAEAIRAMCHTYSEAIRLLISARLAVLKTAPDGGKKKNG